MVELYGYAGYTADLETGDIYGPKGNKLTPSKVHNGYVTVTLKNKRKKVHRLILMTATQCDGNGLQVNHKDGNKENNCVSNLEWCTAKENTQHAERLGLRKHKNSKLRSDCVLTLEEASIIKKLISEGYSTSYIKTIVPKTTPKIVYSIKKGSCYKLIKDNSEIT